MLGKRTILPISIFLFFFFLYIHNLSPDVYGGDVGDLVTAAYTFGVAHPPGYPLFSLLGYIFSHGISFQTVAWRVGLISVLSSALGVTIFFLTIQKITKNTLLAFLSAAILGCNFLYWFYAEIAEVFALHIFLSITLFSLAIFFSETKKIKYLYILSFFLGLSFTNHHTTILILPSLLILCFQPLKKLATHDWKVIIFCMLLGLFGFSIYLYVPFAAARNGPINWDHVHDIASFFHLLLRKDYGTFTAGVFDTPTILQRIIILQNYLKTLVNQLTPPVIFFCLFGIVNLFKRKKYIALSLLIGFIISGPLFITYAGFPLYSSFILGVYERFFLLSSVLLLFFFPFGLLFFLDLVKPYFHKGSLFAIQAIFFIIPLLLLFYNFPKTNLSNTYLGENLGKDMISTLPPHAVVFLAGDTTLFNTQYVIYALYYRPDITVLNVNGLSADPYFQQIQKSVSLKNPSIKDSQKLGKKTILTIAETHPVFSAIDIDIDKDYTWIPHGLLKKFVKKSDTPTKEMYINSQKMIWESFHIPVISALSLKNLTISEFPGMYANALLTNGYYYYSEYKDEKKALEYFNKAILVDINNARAYTILGVYYATAVLDCDTSKRYLYKSLELNPFEKLSYFTLYTLSNTCKDSKIKKDIVEKYEKVFQSNFQKDIKKNDKK